MIDKLLKTYIILPTSIISESDRVENQHSETEPSGNEMQPVSIIKPFRYVLGLESAAGKHITRGCSDSKQTVFTFLVGGSTPHTPWKSAAAWNLENMYLLFVCIQISKILVYLCIT